MKQPPLLRFHTLDSTNTEAQRWLGLGARPPFAITALRQTQGRGQYGRSWISPQGNFYFSCAIDSSQHKGHHPLPLLAATTTHRTLQTIFGLSATLKWPNDLLFAGRKLAGILCEGAFLGHEQQAAAIIGIGINIHTPTQLPDGNNEATSLAEALQDTPQHRLFLAEHSALASLFWRTWWSFWQDLCPQNTADCLAQYGLMPGQPLRISSKEPFALIDGLSNTGALLYRPMQGGPPQSLHTAKARWLYQRPWEDPCPLLVGVSHAEGCQIAFWASPEESSAALSLQLTWDQLSQGLAPLHPRLPCPGWPLWLAAGDSEDPRLPFLIEALQGAGVTPILCLFPSGKTTTLEDLRAWVLRGYRGENLVTVCKAMEKDL